MEQPNRERKGEIKYQITLNPEQKIAKAAIMENQIVVITGRAGVGKTLLNAQCALDLINKKMCDRIYISRPTVEVGKSLGYLPGDLNSKLDPYFEAFMECVQTCLKDKVVYEKVKDKFIYLPIQFIRGRTINDYLFVDECLHSSSEILVKFPDDSVHNTVIHKLPFHFKHNELLKVLSYNHETKETEFKNILNIQIRKTNKWIHIYDTLKDYPLICTPSHPIAVLNEVGEITYKEAKDLKIGNTFIKYHNNTTWKHRLLDHRNLDILVGLLLGDASLSINNKTNNSGRISKNHGLKQKEYMLFCASLYEATERKGPISGFTGKPICGFCSKSHYIPDIIRNKMYVGKRKEISYDINKLFSQRTLATWYMDDGNLGISNRITLHTEGFNVKSIINLQKILKDKFDIDSTITSYTKQGKTKISYYKRITLDKENSFKYFQLIKGLIHPNLKYKVPDIYWEEFNEDLYNIYVNNNSVYTGQIKNIVEEDLLECENTYNMEVEDNNNYFANNVLTHNCQSSTLTEMEAILTRLGKDGKIVICGDLAQKDTAITHDGLTFAIELSKRIPEIKHLKLETNHRSELVKRILDVKNSLTWTK